MIKHAIEIISDYFNLDFFTAHMRQIASSYFNSESYYVSQIAISYSNSESYYVLQTVSSYPNPEISYVPQTASGHSNSESFSQDGCPNPQGVTLIPKIVHRTHRKPQMGYLWH